jgi:hypothetical protein
MFSIFYQEHLRGRVGDEDFIRYLAGAERGRELQADGCTADYTLQDTNGPFPTTDGTAGGPISGSYDVWENVINNNANIVQVLMCEAGDCDGHVQIGQVTWIYDCSLQRMYVLAVLTDPNEEGYYEDVTHDDASTFWIKDGSNSNLLTAPATLNEDFFQLVLAPSGLVNIDEGTVIGFAGYFDLTSPVGTSCLKSRAHFNIPGGSGHRTVSDGRANAKKMLLP